MIQFRFVTTHDTSLLFEFVNEAESLKWKIRTTKAIGWNEHKKWLTLRLNDPNCAMWIIVVDELDAGQLRLDKSSCNVEVDIYIAPNFRRKNIASQALAHAINYARSQWRGVPVTANVKSQNHASVKLFTKAGFLPKGMADQVLRLELPTET